MSKTQVDTNTLESVQSPEATPKLNTTPTDQPTIGAPKLDLTPIQQLNIKLKEKFKKNMSFDSAKTTPNTSRDSNMEGPSDKDRDILDFLNRHESELRTANVWPPIEYYSKEFNNSLVISESSRFDILKKYKDKFLPLLNLTKVASTVQDELQPTFTIFMGEFFISSHPISKPLFELAVNYQKMDLQEIQEATVEFVHDLSNYVGNFVEYKEGLFKLSRKHIKKLLETFLDQPLAMFKMSELIPATICTIYQVVTFLDSDYQNSKDLRDLMNSVVKDIQYYLNIPRMHLLEWLTKFDQNTLESVLNYTK